MRSQLHIPVEQPAIAEFPSISAPPEGIRLLTLVLILARRWVLIAVVTAICTATGIALALLLPARYTAEIVILPPQSQDSSITSALAAQFGGLSSMAQLAGGSLGLKNKNDMYVSMFKSHLVEDAIIQHFNLQAEYRKSCSPIPAKCLRNAPPWTEEPRTASSISPSRTTTPSAPPRSPTDMWTNSAFSPSGVDVVRP